MQRNKIIYILIPPVSYLLQTLKQYYISHTVGLEHQESLIAHGYTRPHVDLTSTTYR